jgi:hypothetical protein
MPCVLLGSVAIKKDTSSPDREDVSANSAAISYININKLNDSVRRFYHIVCHKINKVRQMVSRRSSVVNAGAQASAFHRNNI